MDNIKNNKYYLSKMLEDVEFIIDKMKGISKEDFISNDLLLDSMQFRLIQISENAVKTTTSFQEIHEEIDWFAIKGLRNRLVHDYGNVDYNIVYETLTKDMKPLKKELKFLIDSPI